MEMAASLPALTASTTVAAPVMASPPANTPGMPVAKVNGSTSMVRHLLMVMPLSLGRNARSADWPMAGTMESHSMMNSEPFTGTGRRLPDASGSPSSMRLALDTRYLAVLAHNAHRGDQEVHLDSFFLGLFDLFFCSRHFCAGPAVQDEYVLRAVTDCRTDRVHGNVTAADDRNLVTQEDLFAQVHPLQVIDTVDDALHIFAGDVELGADMGSAAEEHGVVLLASDLQRICPCRSWCCRRSSRPGLR